MKQIGYDTIDNQKYKKMLKLLWQKYRFEKKYHFKIKSQSKKKSSSGFWIISPSFRSTALGCRNAAYPLSKI